MNTISLLSDAKYFDANNPKFQNLRKKLDAKSTKDKLEGMKHLLAMMTIGRDVSKFFPQVVKNVIVESMEIKKLVYMYLINYAESSPDLALLCINTLQKDLSSSSQRVRANAMKAMSSIPLPVVVPLVGLALKTAVVDSSPYVKKAAAAALVKVHYLAPEESDMCRELISDLLKCADPQVLGSALYAFSQVCPTDWELFHPHFDKTCKLLADLDEWGQIVALNLLVRYGRTQFLSPHGDEEDDTLDLKNGESGATADPSKPFYSDDEDEKKESDSDSDKSSGSDSDQLNLDDMDDFFTAKKGGKSKGKGKGKGKGKNWLAQRDGMEDDHKFLLKQSAMLLRSHNAAVVAAVANLYYHLAPRRDLQMVARPLVRLTRSKRAVQVGVLSVILALCSRYPALFRPFLSEFYVFGTDPLFIRTLKLGIMARCVTETNVKTVTREFAFYLQDEDPQFVCAAIKSVVMVANRLPKVSERCISLLMGVVSNLTRSSSSGGAGSHSSSQTSGASDGESKESKEEVSAFTVDEAKDASLDEFDVVAEAVVAIRQLLQRNPSQYVGIIRQLIKLLASTEQPMARCSIVWIVGEYRKLVPQRAPETLRVLARGFREEHASVKLQILNLAVKLYLSYPDQTALLFKYVMDLCKYDLSYDLRDRARTVRALFFRKKLKAGAAHAELEGKMVGLVDGNDSVKEQLKQCMITAKPLPGGGTNRAVPSGSEENKEDEDFFGGSVPADGAFDAVDFSGTSSSSGSAGLSSGSSAGGGLLDESVLASAEDAAMFLRFSLGSLSQFVHHQVRGYLPVPRFTETLPSNERERFVFQAAKRMQSVSSVSYRPGASPTNSSQMSSMGWDGSRTVGSSSTRGRGSSSGKKKVKTVEKGFYSDSEDSDSGSDSDSSSGSSSGSSSDSSSDGSTDSDSDSSDSSDSDRAASKKKNKKKKGGSASMADDLFAAGNADFFGRTGAAEGASSDSSSSGSDSSDSEDLSDTDKAAASGGGGGGSTQDADILESTFGGGDSKTNSGKKKAGSVLPLAEKGVVGVLVDPLKVSGAHGLRVEFACVRGAQSLFGSKFTALDLELSLLSGADAPLANIEFVNPSVVQNKFRVTTGPIEELKPGASTQANLHVDFSGVTDPVRFTIRFQLPESKAPSGVEVEVSLAVPAGELLYPAVLSGGDFEKEAANNTGLNAHSVSVKPTLSALGVVAPGDGEDSGTGVENDVVKQVCRRVLDAFAVSCVAVDAVEGKEEASRCRFVGRMRNDDSFVLLELNVPHQAGSNDKVAVKGSLQCDDFIVGGLLVSSIKTAVKSAASSS